MAENKKDVELVTENDITKAITELENEGYFEKGGDDDDDDEEESGDGKTNAVVEDEDEYKETTEKGVYQKFKKGGKEASDKLFYKKSDDGSYEAYEPAFKPAFSTKDDADAPKPKIKKGVTDDDDAQEAIDASPALKMFADRLEKIEQKLAKSAGLNATVLKGIYSEILGVKSEVEKQGGEPNQRKSISKAVERFDIVDDAAVKNTLSLKNNKNDILNVLDELTFKGGGLNQDMAKAMTDYEVTGRLSDKGFAAIEKEGYKIVK